MPHLSHRLRAGALAGVAAAALAASATVGVTPAGATTPTTPSAAKAAAGWLARQLTGTHADHISGAYGPDAGETADAVLSMDAAGVAQDAAARATSWLAANAKAYLTGNGYSSTYYPGSLAKLLLVAEAQHAHPRNFGGFDLIKELRAEEQKDGAFANSGSGAYYSVVTQSLALIALSDTGTYKTWPDAKAIAWLVRQECPNGGFQTTSHSTCGEADATAFAAQALLTVHSSRAQQAIHWLRTHRNSDGGWGTSIGEASNANSTAIAVQALRQAGYSAAPGLRWLRAHQVTCSGKVARRGSVRYQTGWNYAQAVRATTQAGQALAKKWLADIDKAGATAAAPVLAC
jgi:hypothetical protein